MGFFLSSNFSTLYILYYPLPSSCSFSSKVISNTNKNWEWWYLWRLLNDNLVFDSISLGTVAIWDCKTGDWECNITLEGRIIKYIFIGKWNVSMKLKNIMYFVFYQILVKKYFAKLFFHQFIIIQFLFNYPQRSRKWG